MASDDFAKSKRSISGVEDTVHQEKDPSERPVSGIEETMAQSGPRPDGPAPKDALQLGEVIAGKYRVERRLGTGGFGAVYAAEHLDIQRPVALKVLLGGDGFDPDLVKRFKREARVATRIRHPNIVDVIDFGVEAGRPYLVMELLAGQSLGDAIEERGRLAVREIIPIADGVLRALAAAHKAGVVHRDIKPDNVFLTEHESDPSYGMTVKVLDFGIAKWEPQGDQTRLTKSQMSMGTAAYMAPEQVQSSRDVTQAADQYSAGVLLYEALTGRLPHLASSYNEMIVAKVVSDPEPLSHLRPDLPTELCDVVMRALAKEPSERFEDVSALREALKPFHDFEEDDLAPVIRISQTASAPVPEGAKRAISEARRERVSSDETGAPATITRPARPSWLLPLVATLAILVVGAAIVVGVSTSDDTEQVDDSATTVAETVEPSTPEEAAPTPVPMPAPTPAPTSTEVRFESSPSGASVAIDGERVCTETPCTVSLGDRDARAMVEKPGFRGETLELAPPFDEVVSVTLSRLRVRPTMERNTMTSTPPTTNDGLPFDMM